MEGQGPGAVRAGALIHGGDERAVSPLARFLIAVNRSGARVVPLSVAEPVGAAIGETVHGMWPAKREVAARNFARVLERPPDSREVRRTVRECTSEYPRLARLCVSNVNDLARAR